MGNQFDGLGAGIYNSGNILVADSSIGDNVAFGSGGSIYNDGVMDIRNGTLTGNETTAEAAGTGDSRDTGVAA